MLFWGFYGITNYVDEGVVPDTRCEAPRLSAKKTSTRMGGNNELVTPKSIERNKGIYTL